jgi:hypothetical protein
MKIRQSDVVGKAIREFYCARSSSVGDMSGSSVAYHPGLIVLENGIGIDLEAHQEPLISAVWSASQERDKELESSFASIIGARVTGIYRSDYYPNLIVGIEKQIIVGMNSPAPWCVLPVLEHLGPDDLAALSDFFGNEK